MFFYAIYDVLDKDKKLAVILSIICLLTFIIILYISIFHKISKNHIISNQACKYY